MSDEAFRLLFEHSLDAVVVADDESKFLDVNAPACALFGYTREQMLRMRVGDLVTSEKPGATERYERYLQNGRETGEFIFVRPDNDIRIASYSACRLASGRHLSILRDVTAQRREEELRREAERERERLRQEAAQATQTLNALIDNIPTGLTIADGPDVIIRRVSKHGQALIGRDRTVLEGIPDKEHASKWGILRADGTPARAEELPLTRAAKQGEEVVGEEWVIQRPDGEKITVLCNAGPIHDAAGNIMGGVIAWRDITARKDMERALRQANERLTEVVEGIADAFVSIDHEWRYTYINTAAERMLGRPREELLGRDMRHVYSDPDAQRLYHHYAQAIATRTPISLEEYYAPLGLWMEVRAYPSSDGLSVFFRDISERKRAEAEIDHLNQRLHRAVYESSHRIKNQLQILAATADMALMDGKTLIPADEFRRLGAQIRTLSVLHDILTMEWKQNVTGIEETISSKTMLERVLEMLRQTSRSERVVFQIADTALLVRTATTLALIANEAASNAIKHGKQGVEVSFSAQESRGVLEVCDDGPGFPEGFDPKTAANTGLELISSLAAHDLRGTVRYENREQGGARVVISFPLPDRAVE